MQEMRYQFFTTNEIKPAGWAKQQLRVQADGLCGNLDRVWKDVRDSAWIGGDSEGWERVPYWLDGFIPMAYLLEDADLIARAQKYMDAIIDAQQPDGWICPCAPQERAGYDVWAVLLIAKVLTVYADCSNDARVEDVLERCLKNLYQHLDRQTLQNWGAARWFEGLIPICWLYERRPSHFLLSLAKKLQVQGFDWNGIFASGYIEDCKTGWDYYSHIVNISMMLKSDALLTLFGQKIPETEAVDKILAYLDTYHGTATGHFAGDECLAGLSPVNGTELCGVVEAMYSYEWNFAATGNLMWLDRLEKLAYNALPAAISPDMWSHQYDQMTNQVAAFPMSKHPFRTNKNVSHTFGLEPEYGCCTANFGQGWPKFILSSFMKSKDGIASCALVPAKLTTTIAGTAVSCVLDTGYPFRDTLVYTITTQAPVSFTFSIRIPSCSASAQVNGKQVPIGAFFEISKVWNETETITVHLQFDTRLDSRPADMVSIWRGPLMYAVAIEENWERVEYVQDGVERKYPYCDYYIYPLSKWNYALADDTFTVTEHDFSAGFSGAVPPVEMQAEMYEVEWGFHCGHCDARPGSLVPMSAPRKIRLIPYGYSNLRLAEIPFAPLPSERE